MSEKEAKTFRIDKDILALLLKIAKELDRKPANTIEYLIKKEAKRIGLTSSTKGK